MRVEAHAAPATGSTVRSTESIATGTRQLRLTRTSFVSRSVSIPKIEPHEPEPDDEPLQHEKKNAVGEDRQGRRARKNEPAKHHECDKQRGECDREPETAEALIAREYLCASWQQKSENDKPARPLRHERGGRQVRGADRPFKVVAETSAHAPYPSGFADCQAQESLQASASERVVRQSSSEFAGLGRRRFRRRRPRGQERLRRGSRGPLPRRMLARRRARSSPCRSRGCRWLTPSVMRSSAAACPSARSMT